MKEELRDDENDGDIQDFNPAKAWILQVRSSAETVISQGRDSNAFYDKDFLHRFIVDASEFSLFSAVFFPKGDGSFQHELF